LLGVCTPWYSGNFETFYGYVIFPNVVTEESELKEQSATGLFMNRTRW